MPRFDPVKTLEIVEHDNVKTLLGVPAMFAALLHHPEAGAVRHLEPRAGRVARAARCPAEVLRGVRGGLRVHGARGLRTPETTGIAAFNGAGRRHRPGAIGTPVPGTELCLDGDDGELLVRGPTVMKGYWKRPDATAEALSPDGWLRTGESARAGDDGSAFVLSERQATARGGAASRAGSVGPRARPASMSRCAARRWRRRR